MQVTGHAAWRRPNTADQGREPSPEPGHGRGLTPHGSNAHPGVQDKVNMSVAILPMSQQFGWSASVAGLVQSSFFWGYMLSQVPAGFLANKYSGRNLLPGGVGVWSGFTAAVPLLTTTVRPLPYLHPLPGLLPRAHRA